MCAQSIKLNSITENSFKVALMGEGLKTLNNQNKENIFIAHDLDLLEEKNQDACRAGFTLSMSLNRQEVSVVPKKLLKHGLFERFFHFFK